MARLQRYNTVFSIIVFNVRNLDEINEKAGHVTGQTVLKRFSNELRSNLRITDICFRYGVNKIIAVLPNTNLEQSRLTAAKLANHVKKSKIFELLSNTNLECLVNVGFAEAQRDIQLEHLLEIAERKLDEVCLY